MTYANYFCVTRRQTSVLVEQMREDLCEWAMSGLRMNKWPSQQTSGEAASTAVAEQE